MKKVNPNCPVPGCKAKAPHTSDTVVAGLVQNFSDLGKVAAWTCASIAELGKSMADDIAAGRHFALITRTRQQEELYIRALYAMFIADSGEVAHIMSDATPNSFSEVQEGQQADIRRKGNTGGLAPRSHVRRVYCNGHDQQRGTRILLGDVDGSRTS
jgi:hypothetical protein